MPTVHDLIRQVPCPACHARSGKACFRKPPGRYHWKRLEAYRATFVKPQVRELSRSCF